ncbi:glutamate receptor ionotropic, kainate 2-like [Palaemon carinicauda]|uniref:glutamate receptor ionotropic, kainate 2-like n=1 Tax=Palaemon carinicauda TaxID=392227 RepID=UPI0035B5E518
MGKQEVDTGNNFPRPELPCQTYRLSGKLKQSPWKAVKHYPTPRGTFRTAAPCCDESTAWEDGQPHKTREYEDMMGHEIQVTAKDLFPFIEYELHSQELGTTVTPLDSLDVRMLNSTAKLMNFTYVMRMPMDDEWGTYDNGKWTGMVYTLQQNLADISMMLFWAYERKQVIDFTRVYVDEPFVMVSRKPKPAPQHLALIRPFQGDVWRSVVLAFMGTGVIYWSLQRIWRSFSGFPSVSLDTAVLNVWGILLEEPLVILPFNDTGRILMGWWMMFSMLMLSLYKSSLIAHLSVPITPSPIDTVEQLLQVEGATWGMEPGTGLGWDWFKNNDNPNVQKMFKTLELLDADEQMHRVLDGYHAFFTWKYYIKTIIGSNFTAGLGYTPIHISREEFIPGPTGWGVRKGAPFLDSLDRIQDKLVEAGIVEYWLRELFETAIWKGRMIRKNKILGGEEQEKAYLLVGYETSQEGAVVLNLNHLQGAFFALFLGIILAFLVAVGENTVHATLKP